ncbi:Uncharacterized protein BP5553_06520 [Venustampulla echinocandica]|uniref:EGF-like domain-containing protein n=1 Tax=Venustampulla echinocandica TaxID=2656787 RepID=A0A370TK63_9HELO|nr:Uncharacterized protein BP5553_06520 [Venustampulla echinocandica]RDL35908.1 Uncharacterized protein BP5553_06520 [Venustampulla echinocandica]
MNQQWEPQARPTGGGSVRRARERMEAGLPPDMPPPPRPAYSPPRSMPSQPANRSRPPMPPALATSRNGQSPIGVAISRPTPAPQWPLSGTVEGPDSQSGPQYQPPQGRGVAPQRPPRPSRVPSILDSSKIQDHTPSFQYRPQQNAPDQNQWRGTVPEDEEMMSPTILSPVTPSSRPSTVSSVGTIPDFPVPILAPPRRSVHLGPPPSARRGASSYYSQASYVSPIPEESPRMQTSHGSYASSAAIPSSWGSDYGDDENPDRHFEHDEIEEGRESRESNGDDSDDRGLIRSASLGKRAKPSMVITRGADKADSARPSPRPQQTPKTDQMASASTASGKGGATNSALSSGTGWIDTSTSSSENTIPTLAKAAITDSPNSKSSDQSDPRAREMLAAYNAASTLQPRGPTPTRTPSPGPFTRLSAIRRPPRLDMDAVRDAEARGSLTSLPDLIRRATRLAAMMDRGKRPGSRLNDLNDFPMVGSDDKGYSLTPDEKHRSGLSGMLAAFPPPGAATPREGTPRPTSTWPSGYDARDPDGQRPPRKRRCCGLPCWGAILVILVLLIIIAAAVVVPVELLVINKPNSKAPLSALQQCQADTATACQNGGASLIVTGSCACICTNGFTGSTCTSSGATGCTTTSLPGSEFTDVTLGESLPRLITAAESNFSIPLSSNILLARLSSANLSCSSENALVTFEGRSQRIGNANDIVTLTLSPSPSMPSATSATSASSQPHHRKQFKYPDAVTSTKSIAPSTTSGILVDPYLPSSTAAAPSTVTSASPTATFRITEEALDFARIAVLFVLQEEQLDHAVNAQSALQKFFDLQSYTNLAAMNISLGNGNTVNLLGFTIDLGSGLVGNQSTSKTSGSMKSRKRNLWATL